MTFPPFTPGVNTFSQRLGDICSGTKVTQDSQPVWRFETDGCRVSIWYTGGDRKCWTDHRFIQSINRSSKRKFNLAGNKIKTDTHHHHQHSVCSLIFYKLYSHCTTLYNSINTSWADINISAILLDRDLLTGRKSVDWIYADFKAPIRRAQRENDNSIVQKCWNASLLLLLDLKPVSPPQHVKGHSPLFWIKVRIHFYVSEQSHISESFMKDCKSCFRTGTGSVVTRADKNVCKKWHIEWKRIGTKLKKIKQLIKHKKCLLTSEVVIMNYKSHTAISLYRKHLPLI